MGKEATAADVDPWDDDVELENADRGDNLGEGEEVEETSAAKSVTEEEPEAEETTDEAEEEPEAEAEEEPEAEAEETTDEAEEEPEEEPETNQNYMVPKHRYDTAKERAQRAEQRALELERQLQQGTAPRQQRDDAHQDDTPDFETQLTELDRNHAKALADGDYEQAAQLSAQARQVEREMYRTEIQSSSRQAIETARESAKLEQTIDQVYTQYPTLDPDSGQFDQAKTDEVLRLQNAFSAAGMSAADSVHEAVKYAFNVPEIIPAESKEPAPEKPAGKPRKTDVKKNVDTANKQPPALKGVGSDNGKTGVTESMPDITTLTDEEFDALPESKLRLLRGDEI